MKAYPAEGLAIDASMSYLDQKLKASSLKAAATFTGVPIRTGVVGTNPGGVVSGDPPGVPKWKFKPASSTRPSSAAPVR